jgi:photosystem II stability/assembly factor-like uncharacterized protein
VPRKKRGRLSVTSVVGLVLLLTVCLMTAAALESMPATAARQSAAQPRWTIQRSPTTAALADISCAAATWCVAVGAKATVVRTANGGKTWLRVTTPYGTAHPSAAFASVRCPIRGVCSILAPPNVVIRTTDGGRTWQTHTISLSPQLSGLTKLACPIQLVCFAIASPSGTPDTWLTRSAAVFRTSDGNRSWRRLSIPSSVPCEGDCGCPSHCGIPNVGFDLQWISCQNGRSCRAGGDQFIGSHEGYTSAVIRTDNGGTAWVLAHNNFDPSIATCPTVSICTGVYYEPRTPTIGPQLMRTTDAGSTWTRNPALPFKPIMPIETAIACTGSSFCELAGPHGALTMTIGTRLFRQLSPTIHGLAGVACPRMGDCYAVGTVGTILTRKQVL